MTRYVIDRESESHGERTLEIEIDDEGSSALIQFTNSAGEPLDAILFSGDQVADLAEMFREIAEKLFRDRECDWRGDELLACVRHSNCENRVIPNPEPQAKLL